MCIVRVMSLVALSLKTNNVPNGRKLFPCNYNWINAPSEQPRDDRLRGPRGSEELSKSPSAEPQCPSRLEISVFCARRLIEAFAEDWETASQTRLIEDILETAQTSVASLIRTYQASVHVRFPIIKTGKLCFDQHPHALSGTPDTPILILALCLVTRVPCGHEDHSMRDLTYRTFKQCFMLQTANPGSLMSLQAGLLLAYYECGHGLLREAHVTLAACIAIARLLGMRFDGLDEDDEPGSEYCACRWGIVLLDRFVLLLLPLLQK